MNAKILFGAAALVAAFTVSGAQAATYQFVFTGPDFPGSGPVSFDLTTPLSPGHQGYSGGPDQLWGYTSVLGGWPDFYPGGKDITLEATSLATPYGNLFLASSTPFYALTYAGNANAPSTPFDLSFPGFSTSVDVEKVTLTNDGYQAPGTGNIDTLTITQVPEPATLMMMLLGLAGLGFVGHRKTNKGGATVAA